MVSSLWSGLRSRASSPSSERRQRPTRRLSIEQLEQRILLNCDCGLDRIPLYIDDVTRARLVQACLPPAPRILGLLPVTDSGVSARDGVTRHRSPVLIGQAESGLTVTVLEGNRVVGRGATDAKGIWRVRLPFDLAEGRHVYTAYGTDDCGHSGSRSGRYAVVADRRVGLTVGLPPESDTGTLGDLLTNKSTITLTGTTEPRATVMLLDPMMTTQADPRGSYKFEGLTLPAPDGRSFTVKTTDIAGNTNSVTVRVDRNGGFETLLAPWAVSERDGEANQRGSASATEDFAVLREGDSYATTMARAFVVPANPTPLQVYYSGLSFNTSDPSFINDAFEMALIDEQGNPLVSTITPGRDAFYNVTEGQVVTVGQSVTPVGGKVIVPLGGVPAGTRAILVFRFVNNDSDAGGSVRFDKVFFPSPDPVTVATKFFVVDSSKDRTLRFGVEGINAGEFPLGAVGDPSGAASNPAGDTLWVVDKTTKQITVFNSATGAVRGSWAATDAANPQGVTVHNGTLWLVDRDGQKVLRYVDGQDRRAGSATATDSFALAAANVGASDLVTDGSTVWVTDDLLGEVFVYDVAGTLLGRWKLDADNSKPSGITRNPAGGADLWVLDRARKQVFHYPGGGAQRSGELRAAGTFQLDSRSSEPEGIADPPPQSPEGYSYLDPDGRAVFDTADDFRAGELFNVTPVDATGEIVLNAPGEIDIPPFIWVSNSNEGTLSRFDTRTGVEVGRYRTGPLGGTHSPSRTAVTGDGSVWVANRAFNAQASVVHVLLEDYIDRNGNGVVDTSVDLNGDGRITGSEVLPWDANADGQPDDERIALSVNVGRNINNPSSLISNGVARSITLDASDNVWVGLFNLGQYEVYDPAGNILKIIDTPSASPYGAVVDANGMLWSANLANRLTQIDTNTRTFVRNISTPGATYGVTLDPDGIVWTSLVNSAKILRYDPATGEQLTYDTPNGENTLRGIGVDNDRNVWVASSGSDRMVKFEFAEDHKTLTNRRTVNVGNEPTAAVIDADGFVWTTTRQDDRAWKIDPATNAVVPGWPKLTGDDPYNYSDMTGQVRLGVTQREGTWKEIVDSQRPGVPWAGVGVEANTPTDTSVVIRVRAADSKAELASRPFRVITSDAVYRDIVGRYLEVEVRLRSRNPDLNPSVRSITVTSVPPPDLSVTSPTEGATLPQGATVTLDGVATAAQPELGPGLVVRNRIVAVLVNGVAVEQLDAAGRFFTPVEVRPGENKYIVTAIDEYGQSTTVVRTVMPEVRTVGGVDFSQFVDLTSSFTPEYARTSFRESERVLYADLAIKNTGLYPAYVPLLVGIKNISDPTVRPLNVAGVLPDGTPYFDFTGLVSGGAKQLVPQATTGTLSLAFATPGRAKFTYDLVFYGLPNRPPVFTSIPPLEATVGRAYSYDANGTDPDGDMLRFALVSGPVGASIHETTGVISWTPTAAQVGNFPFVVRVDDRRGGVAEQAFTVVSETARPNRPPVFTSVPEDDAVVGAMYSYDANALDPDGDTLRFGLLAGAFPPGMSIDPISGAISWTPTASQLGEHPVTVTVDDLRGGTARQTYTVCVTQAVGLGSVTGKVFLDYNRSGVQDRYDPSGSSSGGVNSTPTVKLTRVSTSFNSPIGIDYYPVTDSILVTANYNSGGFPNNFETILADGSHVPFSNISGLGDEIKIATVRTAMPGGFPVGDLFSGNGVDGEIVRITDNGQTVLNPWVSLPGSGNGLMRGGLHVDTTGVFGGDLIVVTTGGEVWRINPAGQPTRLAAVGTHLEGVCTIPNNPARYGPLAGKILAGAETQGLLYVISAGGEVQSFNVGVAIEDVDLVPADGNFFGVNFGTGFILGAPASEFASMVGDVLLTQESHGGSGLYRLFWDGTALRSEQLPLEAGSAGVGQWEHVTFGPAGIVEIPGLVPEPNAANQVVYADENSDGDRDPDEAFTLTDATGNYELFGLASGSHLVRVELQPGWSQTAPATGFRAVVVGSGQTTSGVDFGVVDNCAPATTREFDPVVEWHKSAFAVSPESDQVMMTPSVMDVNNDTIPDVIFTTFAGNGYASNGILRAISGRDGSEIWSVTDSRYRINPGSHLAVGDIDGDDLPEIIAMHESSGVIVFENDGTFKWRSDPVWGISYAGGPSLADLDQDGTPEIIFGATAIKNNGTILWRGDESQGSGLGSNAGYGALSTVADIDKDGKPEVVAGRSAYRFDGTLMWNADIPDGYSAIGNFDGDPQAEIVVVASGNVYLLEHTKEVIWGPIGIPNTQGGGAPVIADLAGDAAPEIVIVGLTNLLVLKADGSTLWSKPIQENSVAITGASVFDFDGNGRAEVVFGDERAVRIYEGLDGTILYTFPRGSATISEYAFVADVDGDGSAEIIAVANAVDGINVDDTNGIYVIGDRNKNWVNTRRIWNQHTYHITNVNDDGSIPTNEANSWEVYNTYRLNVLTSGFDPRSSPDLVVETVARVDPATPLKFKAHVKNMGYGVAPIGLKVAVYDGEPARGGKVVGTAVTTKRLLNGESEDVIVTLTATTLNDLLVRVDPDNTVGECDETNNDLRGNIDLDPTNFAPAFNHAPTASELSAVANTAYRITPRVLDPDGDVLTFDLPAAPTGMLVHPTLGVVAWLPSRSQLGEHQVVLRAKDTAGNITLLPFTVTVAAPNTAPVITTTPPAGPAVVGLPFEYRLRAQDAETESLTYSLVNPLPGMTFTDGVFRWTPAAAQAGPRSVTLRVSDGIATAEQTLALNVVAAAPNRAPTVTVDVTTAAWLGRSYAGRLLAADADGDPVRFSVVAGMVPNGMSIDAETGVITWTPSAAGSYPVRLRAHDNRGGEAFADFTITVASADTNRAPVVVSNPPLSAHVGAEFTYQLAARDPDGDPVVWELVAGPQGMSIDRDRGLLRWTPAADQDDTHQVRVRVLDQLFASGEQAFDLKVTCANQAPFLTSRPPTVAYVNEPYTYAVRATDPDGDPLTFSLANAPTGMAFLPGTSILRWTPTLTQAPSQPVEIVVTDGNGNAARQAFTVTVSTESPNRPPVITSRPITTATVGRTYTYMIMARDSDGDPLTFTKLVGPADMTLIDGKLTWTPTVEEMESVTIEVADGRGGVAVQRFDVTARNNQAPTVGGVPSIAPAVIGGTFRTDLRASDPEGDPLTFRLDQGPAGLTIDPLGRVSWKVTGSPRTETVKITILDSDGLEKQVQFDIPVVADTQGPSVTIGLSSTLVTLGTAVRVSVRASDNVGVKSVSLQVTQGGVTTDLPLDANGQTTFTPGPGRYTLTARATDVNDNPGSATADLRVLDPADQTGPDVAFTRVLQMVPGGSMTLNPNSGPVTVTYLADLYGSITDAQLESWKVQVANVADVDLANLDVYSNAWRVIGTGTAAVTDGKLATFDPTMLTNDRYVVAVIAFDTNGQGTVKTIELDVQGEAKLGEFRLEFTDLNIPLIGIPITITRVYDTRESSVSGDFGYGWRLGLRDARIRETAEDVNGFIPNKTKVYLTAPDGTRVGFTYQEVKPQGTWFGTIWQADFKEDPGITWKLSVPDPTVARGGILGALSGPVNFDVYRLTSPDGTVYEYDERAGLKTIQTRIGNSVTFNRDGVVHSSGASITFERDGSGRIAAVVDPDGNRLRYTYDAIGNLVSAADQLGHTTRITYRTDRPHYLDEIIDPLGRRAAKTEYDDAGRVKAVTDGNGSRTEQLFDPSSFTETVKDANGNPTVITYNDRGNAVKTVLHSAAGDVVTQTFYEDPVNPDRETKVIDPNGGVTITTYDPRGNVTSVTDAAGNTTRTTYDAANHVTSVTDALGHTTASFYDAAGNLVQVVDPSGASRRATQDNQGRVETVTDATGLTTTFLYDAACPCGSPHEVINSDGTSRTFEMTSFGQITSVTDENGHTTKYDFGPTGLLMKITDANGGVTSFGYDALGNRTRVTDPNQNVTTFEYDAARRIIVETDPFLNKTLAEYDGAGNLKKVIDREGRVRAFEYDAANRQTLEKWHAPNGTLIRTITSTYDLAGNLKSKVDPDGTLSWTYDDLNRIKTESRGGTPGVPAGTLSFGYDSVGNVTSVSDDSGVQVSSTYDARNLLDTRTWQGGGISPTRIDFDYNASGQLTHIDRLTDVPGTHRSVKTVIGYKATRGLVESIESRGAAGATLSSFGYTYDPAGLVRTFTDGGQSATYGYDKTGQLLSADYSDNALQPDETFHYDANGNRDQGGYVVGKGNRIDTDGTFNYAYDKEGNLVRKTVIVTGNVIEYTYDHRNRLTSVAERSAGGIVLNESLYAYDVLGRRNRVIENGTATHTVYNGQNAWADLGPGGAVTARYLFGNGIDTNLAGWRPGKGVVWYLTDRSGSIRTLAEATEGRVNRLTYSAFGRLLAESDPQIGDRYAYMGREWDDVAGAYYFRARYYDATTGRFTTQDPLKWKAGDPNLYRFVSNRPLNLTDPTGTISLVTQVAITAGIIGAVGTVKGYIACAIVRGETITITELTKKATFGFVFGFSLAYTRGALAISNLQLGLYVGRPVIEGTFCALVPAEYDPRHYFGVLLNFIT